MEFRIGDPQPGGPGPDGGPGRRLAAPWLIYAPGVCFVGMGAAILVFEELLRYLVAVALVLIGLVLLSAASRIGSGVRSFVAMSRGPHRQPFDPPGSPPGGPPPGTH